MQIKKTFLAFIAMFALPFAVVGCAGFTNATGIDLVVPVSEDFSLEQNAYASLAAYAAAAEVTADIIEDPATPDGVKTVLATALLNSEGPASALNDGWATYAKIKADIDVRLEAGAGVPEALLSQAGIALFEAQSLWREHGDAVQSFPGIVKAVQSTQVPVIEE